MDAHQATYGRYGTQGPSHHPYYTDYCGGRLAADRLLDYCEAKSHQNRCGADAAQNPPDQCLLYGQSSDLQGKQYGCRHHDHTRHGVNSQVSQHNRNHCRNHCRDRCRRRDRRRQRLAVRQGPEAPCRDGNRHADVACHHGHYRGAPEGRRGRVRCQPMVRQNPGEQAGTDRGEKYHRRERDWISMTVFIPPVAHEKICTEFYGCGGAEQKQGRGPYGDPEMQIEVEGNCQPPKQRHGEKGLHHRQHRNLTRPAALGRGIQNDFSKIHPRNIAGFWP